MNKNPNFTPQKSEESFYENSECYNDEANYEDVSNEPRMYYNPSTDEGQLEVLKTLLFEGIFLIDLHLFYIV